MKIRFTAIILLALIIGALIAGLVGCQSPKKAIAKYRQSSTFAQDCANDFPFTTTQGKTDTTFLPGQTVIDCDSATAFYEAYWNAINAQQYNGMKAIADSIVKMQAKRPPVRVPCPPNYATHRVDTFINTAAIAAANRRAAEIRDSAMAAIAKANKATEKAKAQLKKQQQKTARRTKQRNTLFGLILAFAAWHLRHSILSLSSSGLSIILGLFRKLTTKK